MVVLQPLEGRKCEDRQRMVRRQEGLAERTSMPTLLLETVRLQDEENRIGDNLLVSAGAWRKH